MEEMPGTRLTFTTAANTPDAIAFLAGRPVAERLLFHAACGRLHLWPSVEEVAEVVRELAGRGFTLIAARAATRSAAEVVDSTDVLRKRLRAALDPHGTWALATG